MVILLKDLRKMLYVLIIQICTKRSGHGPLFPDPDMVLYFRIRTGSFISGSGYGPLFPDPDLQPWPWHAM